MRITLVSVTSVHASNSNRRFLNPKAEMRPKRPNQWIHTWSSTCQHCLHSPPTPTSFRREFFPTEFGIDDHFPTTVFRIFRTKKKSPSCHPKKIPGAAAQRKKTSIKKSSRRSVSKNFPLAKALVSEDACFFYINVAKPGWLFR